VNFRKLLFTSESVCKFGASDVPKAMAVRRGSI